MTPWHRTYDLQLCTMKVIVLELLQHCASAFSRPSAALTRGKFQFSDLYVPGEVSFRSLVSLPQASPRPHTQRPQAFAFRATLHDVARSIAVHSIAWPWSPQVLSTPVALYTSPANPTASRVAAELSASHVDILVTRSPPSASSKDGARLSFFSFAGSPFVRQTSWLFASRDLPSRSREAKTPLRHSRSAAALPLTQPLPPLTAGELMASGPAGGGRPRATSLSVLLSSSIFLQKRDTDAPPTDGPSTQLSHIVVANPGSDDPPPSVRWGLGKQQLVVVEAPHEDDDEAWPTHMLLHLTAKTFPNWELADELRGVLAAGLPILLIHEGDPLEDSVEFDAILARTPAELISSGLYAPLAVPWQPGEHRQVSIKLATYALGACDTRERRFLSRYLDLGNALPDETLPSRRTSVQRKGKSTKRTGRSPCVSPLANASAKPSAKASVKGSSKGHGWKLPVPFLSTLSEHPGAATTNDCMQASALISPQARPSLSAHV